MNSLGLILIAGATLAGVGRYVTQRRKRQQLASHPQPETLIIEPPDEVVITRQDDDHLEICWRGDTNSATLYAGPDPQALDRSRPVATVQGNNCVTLPDPLPDKRPYFEIVRDNRPAEIVAERRLPLEGIGNMRDIGGYVTADGRCIRWGQVYRAGSLSEATESDMVYLHNLNIRLVCDFRMDDERQSEPDRLPDQPQPRYLHLPVNADANPAAQLRAIMFNPRDLYSLIRDGYTRQMVEVHAHVFGNGLHHLADPANLPAVIHCTAGKDRTGVMIALLLAALGVPDETIVADYSLTNHNYPRLRQYMTGKFKQPQSFILGVSVDDITPILTADPALMQDTLDYIRRQYGTVENYLDQKAGVGAETRAALRDNLLD